MSQTIEKLTENGFTRIDAHPTRIDLVVGARVRNSSERYASAIHVGTATVIAIMRKGSNDSPGSWEQSYGRPNVEVVVRRDTGVVIAWADYGTVVVDPKEH